MATNNEGMGGVKIEHIAVEASTQIGTQAPNKFVGAIESDDRVTLPVLNISPTKGCTIKTPKFYDCDPIDTSWLGYGGYYTLGVGNKWNIRVGGGGIYTETSGPIVVVGEISTHQLAKGFFVQTNLFQVIAKKRMHLMGTRLDLEFKELYLRGNAKFLNNVIVNGGMYVNGELICNHITTQKQANLTEFNSDNKAFINPAMSFHIYNGSSLAAKKYVHEGLLSGIWNAIDWTDADEKFQGGMIDVEVFFNLDPILQLLPGLGDIIGTVLRQIHIPVKVAFPKGISLISDATDSQNAALYTTLTSRPRILGESMDGSDTFGPGHQHSFSGPACNYVNSTTDVYAAAKDIEQDKPLLHKSTVPNGADSIEKAKEEIMKMGQDYVEKYVTEFGKMMLPSWAQGLV